MQINNLNQCKYTGSPSFGYNIKISPYDCEQYFKNTAERVYKNNPNERVRYLQAVEDFKNKRFDGTKLYNFYQNKINNKKNRLAPYHYEWAYNHWQTFWNKLTENPTKNQNKYNKEVLSFFKQIFTSKNNKNQKNDLSAIDINVTSCNRGYIDFNFAYHNPSIDFDIGDIDYFFELEEDADPDIYMQNVFNSADGIYNFMKRIESTVENDIIKPEWHYLFDDDPI